MARLVQNVSIGVKIFGITIGMLILLVIVASNGYNRTRDVHNEMIDIAEYLVPITAYIAEIDVYALKQEIHIERVFRLYEIEPINHEHIQVELAKFEEYDVFVDEGIEKAIALANQAIEHHAQSIQDIIELARFEPVLKILQKEHQEFHDYGRQIGNLLQQGKKEEAELFQTFFEDEEEDFNEQVKDILLALQQFTARSADVAESHERQAIQISWLLVSIASVLGILSAWIVAIRLVRPVKDLLEGTKQVEKGNLDVYVEVSSRDEIESLADVFNTMICEIQQKEQIKVTFGQYVDARIVDELIQHQTLNSGVNKQTMTVFFSDIADFSTISEMLTPVGLVNLINQYMTLASEPIIRYDGMIDKFIGDAVVAFWGAPFVSEEEHAKLACYAALEQLNQLAELRRLMPDLMGFRRGLPEVNIRIGLATGELVSGNIGSENSRSYTVLGNAVEIAEHLEGMSKIYGTTILILEDTRQLAGDAIETREIDRIYVTGRDEPVSIYELLSLSGRLDPIIAELRETFEKGLKAYQRQDWDEARRHFENCLAIKSNDGPAKVYLERSAYLREHPPAPDWDGVWSDLSE